MQAQPGRSVAGASRCNQTLTERVVEVDWEEEPEPELELRLCDGVRPFAWANCCKLVCSVVYAVCAAAVFPDCRAWANWPNAWVSGLF